jgi:peptidoglycan/xylan/chitin deacetylase (PgdA/CDA1 family)
MNNMTATKELKEDLKEFSVVMSMSVGLLVFALLFVFYIVRNYVDVNSILGGGLGEKKIYLYLPDENLKRVKELGLEYNYNSSIKYIHSLKKYKIIDISTLKNINTKIPLLLIDNFVLSKDEKYLLKQYIQNGGSIIFNFNVDKKFLKEITGLENVGYIQREKGNIFYLISKRLSPIQIPDSKRLDIVLYDRVPIFVGKKPNLLWTNWAINNTIYNKDKEELPNGALWSGRYKKGSWIYFSFPFYSFRSVESQEGYYKKLFENMLDYAFYRYKVVKYPYLDSDKMIFISEDTEFRFENLEHFSNMIKKYEINATAFCVGKLAEKHPKMVKKAGEYIEIASHSYSHTDLLNADRNKLDIEVRLNRILLHNLSGDKIIGFRPPREQTNKRLREVLKESGFKYVLEKNLGQLAPKYDGNLMIIPRTGTDDYAYLIQLDWDKEKIIKRIVKEMKFITSLNAIYTLSTHTHLFSYKSNIFILEEAIKEFKKSGIPILSGAEIVKKIETTKQIELKSSLTDKNILVQLKNNNPFEVKRFVFRVYGSVVNVTSDFINIKSKIIKKGEGFVDIEVSNIPKFAEVTLFLEREK